MIYASIHSSKFLKKCYRPFGLKVGRSKVKEIISFINSGDKILDIGSGNGCLVFELTNQGHDVVPLDIKSMSLIEEITPVVYDGVLIPFKSAEFDLGLLITTLHHSEDPKHLIEESLRVSNKLLIVEETYTNKLERFFIQATDFVVNWGHSPMTFQNKSHNEWLGLLSDCNCKVLKVEKKRFLLFFMRSTFFVQKPSKNG